MATHPSPQAAPDCPDGLTDCETVALIASLSVPVKTEPCSPPDAPLPPPADTCRQRCGMEPLTVGLQPFSATDSLGAGRHNNRQHQTGFEIVFKSEPLSESEAEEEPGPVMLKERPPPDAKAGRNLDRALSDPGQGVDGGALDLSSSLSFGKCCDDGEVISNETASVEGVFQDTVSSVNGTGVTQETVPLNIFIKTEPVDDGFCVGMGLLSSTSDSKTMSIIQGVGELNAQNRLEEGRKNTEEEEGEEEEEEERTLTEMTQRKRRKKQVGRKSLQCPQCPSTFPCLSHLQRHLLSHSEERPFACSVCQARFKLRCHLKQHSATHTGDRPFTCLECPATFTRSDHLKQHVLSHRGVRPYLCTTCDMTFTQAAHLRKHTLRHRDDRVVVCKVKACRAVFASVRALEEHRKGHEEDRRCKECRAVLSRADDMKKHMRVHTKDKPFACPQCPARFTQAGHLSTHQLQHTGTKPFACERCGCAFKQSHHLKRHMEVHRGQGPFSCQVCGASFRRGSSLTRHGQKCHTPSPSNTSTTTTSVAVS